MQICIFFPSTIFSWTNLDKQVELILQSSAHKSSRKRTHPKMYMCFMFSCEEGSSPFIKI